MPGNQLRSGDAVLKLNLAINLDQCWFYVCRHLWYLLILTESLCEEIKRLGFSELFMEVSLLYSSANTSKAKYLAPPEVAWAEIRLGIPSLDCQVDCPST